MGVSGDARRSAHSGAGPSGVSTVTISIQRLADGSCYACLVQNGYIDDTVFGERCSAAAISPLMCAWRASSLPKVSKIQNVVGEVRAAYAAGVVA